MLARLLDNAYGPAPHAPGLLQGHITGSGSPAVHVFDSLAQAEQVIRSLAAAGIDTKSLSLVVRVSRTEDRAMGFHSAGDRVKSWGGADTFCGGIWESLFMPAVFDLPGLGLVALAGPLVAVLLPVLEGAVAADGTSALGAALMQIGVPRDRGCSTTKAALSTPDRGGRCSPTQGRRTRRTELARNCLPADGARRWRTE